MSLTAQQKRDKEARIQARKEIRDQKKKEIREEKRLNKAKDSLRQRWEENGWKIEEKPIEVENEDRKERYEYHFKAVKACKDSSHYICVDGCLFRDDKIDVVVNASFYLKGKYYPAEIRQPELGLAYEQYRRIEKILKEKYAELNKTVDEEVERVEHIISKVEDPEYRHGKHKKYHKELLRELNKTLDSTKKQAKDKNPKDKNFKDKNSKDKNSKKR